VIGDEETGQLKVGKTVGNSTSTLSVVCRPSWTNRPAALADDTG
jgi:hypothetical protein